MGAFFRFLVDAKGMGKFEALWRIGYLEWVSFFLSLLWIFCENLLEWSGKERKGKGGGKWEEKMIRMKERHLGSLSVVHFATYSIPSIHTAFQD